MKINLVTQDQTKILHSAETPEFKPPPDVIEWDERLFKRVGYDGPVVVYAQCFAYTVVDA